MTQVAVWLEKHKQGKSPQPLTYRETLEPAMKITAEDEAKAYVDLLVEYLLIQAPDKTEEELREITLSNIGYWSGYYDHEVMVRVHRLFGAVHPIFGAINDESDVPTPRQAFEMGTQMAKTK